MNPRILFLLLLGGWFRADAAGGSDATAPAEAELNRCKITAVTAYAWRDWMPVVSKPGPDGGSPLHLKVTLQMDNSRGEANRFTYQAVLLNEKGESVALPFKILPNFRVLPDEVTKSYRTLDSSAKQEAIAKYNVDWDGSLKPSEVREVVFACNEGPYWPVGSVLWVEITWKDSHGKTGVVRSAETTIHRTD